MAGGEATGILPLGTTLPDPCIECGGTMVLRRGKYGLFYGCCRWPDCEGVHGAHANGKPLGVQGDKATRKARMRAHEAFDKIWKSGRVGRSSAYHWLAGVLGITVPECHIGRFNIAQCDAVVVACDGFVYGVSIVADTVGPRSRRARKKRAKKNQHRKRRNLSAFGPGNQCDGGRSPGSPSPGAGFQSSGRRRRRRKFRSLEDATNENTKGV